MLKTHTKLAYLMALFLSLILVITQVLVLPVNAQVGTNNGTIPVSAPISLPNGGTPGSTIKIYASGTKANNEYPLVALFVDYKYQTYFVVDADAYKGAIREYTYVLPYKVKSTQIQVGFVNDYYDPNSGADRNLFVDKITIDGQIYQSEDVTTYSKGSWVAGSAPCEGGYAKSEWLFCNGYFSYSN